MCGRFALGATIEAMAEKFRATPQLPLQQPATVLTPGMAAPLVVGMPQQRFMVAGQWGFPLPSKKLVINARVEGAAQRPMFAEAFTQRRGIVPATAFYEWENTAAGKVRHEFSLPDSEAFPMAVLYDFPQDIPEPRFVIITVPAKDPVLPIHSRMPLVLHDEQVQDWLYASPDSLNLQSFLQANRIKDFSVANELPRLFAP